MSKWVGKACSNDGYIAKYQFSPIKEKDILVSHVLCLTKWKCNISIREKTICIITSFMDNICINFNNFKIHRPHSGSKNILRIVKLWYTLMRSFNLTIIITRFFFVFGFCVILICTMIKRKYLKADPAPLRVCEKFVIFLFLIVLFCNIKSAIFQRKYLKPKALMDYTKLEKYIIY